MRKSQRLGLQSQRLGMSVLGLRFQWLGMPILGLHKNGHGGEMSGAFPSWLSYLFLTDSGRREGIFFSCVTTMTSITQMVLEKLKGSQNKT